MRENTHCSGGHTGMSVSLNEECPVSSWVFSPEVHRHEFPVSEPCTAIITGSLFQQCRIGSRWAP